MTTNRGSTTAPGTGSRASTTSSTVTSARFAASTASFWTPLMPQSWTLPARSARWAWMIVTSGFSAATAVSVSPVNGQRTVDTVGVCRGRSVPAEARSTAKGRPAAPAT